MLDAAVFWISKSKSGAPQRGERKINATEGVPIDLPHKQTNHTPKNTFSIRLSGVVLVVVLSPTGYGLEKRSASAYPAMSAVCRK